MISMFGGMAPESASVRGIGNPVRDGGGMDVEEPARSTRHYAPRGIALQRWNRGREPRHPYVVPDRGLAAVRRAVSTAHV